eukprot:scaffold266063_cov17-Tisochrysis_lutea.AAC.2
MPDFSACYEHQRGVMTGTLPMDQTKCNKRTLVKCPWCSSHWNCHCADVQHLVLAVGLLLTMLIQNNPRFLCGEGLCGEGL